MAYTLHLSGQRWRPGAYDHVLMMLEADRLERRPHTRGMADARTDLADLDRLGVGYGLRRLGGTLTGMPDERSRHGPPPSPLLSTCSRVPRRRGRARARSLRRSSGDAGHRARPGPCCADWSTRGSSSEYR